MLVRKLRRAPAAKLFMARALLARRGSALPDLAVQLAPARTPSADLASYLHLTGLAGGKSLPLVWPQVWGFRLQMALLTDRVFPLPIWSALQVRNRLVQHAPLSAATRYALAGKRA